MVSGSGQSIEPADLPNFAEESLGGFTIDRDAIDRLRAETQGLRNGFAPGPMPPLTVAPDCRVLLVNLMQAVIPPGPERARFGLMINSLFAPHCEMLADLADAVDLTDPGPIEFYERKFGVAAQVPDDIMVSFGYPNVVATGPGGSVSTNPGGWVRFTNHP